jgi:hypothetical protein
VRSIKKERPPEIPRRKEERKKKSPEPIEVVKEEVKLEELKNQNQNEP